jgi:hypothetical protein
MEVSEPSTSCCVVEADNISSSSAQKEVSSIIRGLGFGHDEEVSPWKDDKLSAPPGMLAMDMAYRKKMMAIEFDGPSHFLQEIGSGNVLELENGATKAKRRFQEHYGTLLLLGLRCWWNKVEGEMTTWIFESAKDTQVIKFDTSFFWMVLYITPALWCALLFIGILKFNLGWLIIVAMVLT